MSNTAPYLISQDMKQENIVLRTEDELNNPTFNFLTNSHAIALQHKNWILYHIDITFTTHIGSRSSAPFTTK